MHWARVGGREGDAGELATVGPTLRPGAPILAAIVVARAAAPVAGSTVPPPAVPQARPADQREPSGGS